MKEVKKYAWKEYIALFLSVLFHPLFIPIYTVTLYFFISPNFFLSSNIKFLEFYLLIVSIIIPLLFLLTFKYGGFITSSVLKTPKERLYFSFVMLTVYFILTQKIASFHIFIELLPFFIGISLSVLLTGIFNFFNKKPSLHATALGGAIGFLIIWSYYTQLNIIGFLIILIFITTLVLAARVYLEAHDLKEIGIGFLIGIITQIIAFGVSYFFL